jgi:hypothetical protein
MVRFKYYIAHQKKEDGDVTEQTGTGKVPATLDPYTVLLDELGFKDKHVIKYSVSRVNWFQFRKLRLFGVPFPEDAVLNA